MSLSTHFCDCGYTSLTCKHILALQMIVKELYLSFNDEMTPSSNANVEPTFEPFVEDVHNKDFMNECISKTSDGENFGTSYP